MASELEASLPIRTLLKDKSLLLSTSRASASRYRSIVPHLWLVLLKEIQILHKAMPFYVITNTNTKIRWVYILLAVLLPPQPSTHSRNHPSHHYPASVNSCLATMQLEQSTEISNSLQLIGQNVILWDIRMYIIGPNCTRKPPHTITCKGN